MSCLTAASSICGSVISQNFRTIEYMSGQNFVSDFIVHQDTTSLFPTAMQAFVLDEEDEALVSSQ